MPFKPGKSGNLNGRGSGNLNKKTEQWEIFSAYCLDGGLKKFKEELTKLEGKAYVDAYLSLLEFHQPKLQRSEIKATIEGEIVTTTYTIGIAEGKPIEIEI